jgi:hypothetical protein
LKCEEERELKGEGRKQKKTVHLLTAAGRYSVTGS